MNDPDLLSLHREIVSTPSVSGAEGALADRLEGILRERGAEPQRFGRNLFALCGSGGPLLCLNSHLDTIPPVPGWTRAPHAAERIDGRVYGLGSNDAKASVAAMIAAFLRLKEGGGAFGARVLLALVAEEEIGGAGGAQGLVPELRRRGLGPGAVVVGEPTGLDIAVAQKGLLVLELRTRGQACHAAHARALGAENALTLLARDLVAVAALDLGAPHATLGAITIEPTVISGGTARNVMPAEASATLDVRTNPSPDDAAVLALVRRVVHGEVSVLAQKPSCATYPEHALVRAATGARPEARCFGSRTLSDLVYFDGIPGIKVGPGETERSHTPDEFVFEREVVQGARFYEAVALRYGANHRKH